MAADERRVTSHIILGDLPESEMVTILVDGKPMQARKGRDDPGGASGRGNHRQPLHRKAA